MKKNLLTLISLLTSTIYAQDLYEVARTTAPIEIDGVVNEQAWKSVEPFPMTMYTPVYQGELTEKTEIRMCYDDEYIYFSGVFLDSDHKGIQGNSLLRDGDPGGDFFNVLLDTYNDNENFSTFSTMPSGNRLDAEILNDAEGDQSQIFNASWNTFWSVATTRNDAGWYAEMKIPFSSLRFDDNNGNVIFGLITHRLIGRKNERQTFPAIPPNWNMAAWKPSRAQKILLTGIKRKNPIYFTPYVLGNYQQNSAYDSTRKEIADHSDTDGEVGLDVKFALSSNLTLDLTLNTDFAQVEADNVQVNLTRFSLFFPEKRQFFQERSGVFSFTTSNISQNRLFHSRRIGLDENGNLLRVYGGGRLVGRFKNLDVGVLTMQTEGSDPSISSENFGIVRLRKRVLNAYSYLGTLITSRVDSEGNYNFVTGADALLRVAGPYYLTIKGGHVFSDHLPDSENSMGYIKWEKRAVSGLGYIAEAEYTGKNFDPGVGFVLRKNNLALNQNVVYGHFIDGQWVRKLEPFAANSIFLRNNDQSLETMTTEPGILILFASGADISFSVLRTYDEVKEDFALSEEAFVPAGNHTFSTLNAAFNMSNGRMIRTSVSGETGKFYDGDKASLSISPTWIPSKHFQISLNYTFNRIEFTERDQLLRADIASATMLAALDTKWSLRSLVQYSKLNNKVAVNTGLRYNHKEGNDLYLVYNQVSNTVGQDIEGIELPGTESWSLTLKYTYTFIR
ncbi:hypothetical protein C900_03921 [Fulvivirga imtechensis AK7]|uniref:Uncharacterized protein n=1 Tax=Fulvivirga imtechensis AK7 TaxID=1237149 RepID=L8JMU7_9BACT|nr:carbohydrate binding family 9 domain-containing protein [Fulvivirga imtechensis]ELR70236.1 hypothetical protein C900_03921 [Fulvivirga imtechensis AK7]